MLYGGGREKRGLVEKVFLIIVKIKFGFLPQKKLSFQRNAQQIE